MKLHLIATIQKVASGYPRFIQMVNGQAIAVKTIGIISADKSCEDLYKKEKEDCLTKNKENREKLKNELQELRVDLKDIKIKTELPGYRPMEGVYGGVREKSFMVTNISRNRLLELANKYNQESVIFGSPKNEKENKMYFQYLKKNEVIGKWEIISESEGKIKGLGKLGKDTTKRLDSSILKGQRFKIEFDVVPPVTIEFPISLTDESDNNQINKVSAFKDSYLYVYLDNG